MTTFAEIEEPWFQTASGQIVLLKNPNPDSIRIEDIAVALARICRFGGHISTFGTDARNLPHYSVAQHSVVVSLFVPPELATVGLLHDATEAYLGDVITPLKNLLPGYKELESKWALAIGERFGLGRLLADLPAAVKEYDLRAFVTEAAALVRNGTGREWWVGRADLLPIDIRPMPSGLAMDMFLTRFEYLSIDRSKA